MSKLDIIRAWKDEDYANSLTDAQRAMLPQNPAGIIELTDRDLDGATGAAEAATISLVTICSLDSLCMSFLYSCITLGCTITIGASDIQAS